MSTTLAPTAADVASMNTDAGYGGADFSNFISGKYAMIVMGRYCLIRFREVQQQKDMTIQFAVSQLPMYDYKNHPITVRAAMPYRGSKHPELAKLFLQFLASKPYNQYIGRRRGRPAAEPRDRRAGDEGHPDSASERTRLQRT